MRYWKSTFDLPQLTTPVLWIMPKKDDFTSFETSMATFPDHQGSKTGFGFRLRQPASVMVEAVFESFLRQQIVWLDGIL